MFVWTIQREVVTERAIIYFIILIFLCSQRKVSVVFKYSELLTYTVPVENCTSYTLCIVRCLFLRPTEERVTKWICSNSSVRDILPLLMLSSIVCVELCLLSSIYLALRSLYGTVLYMPLDFQFLTAGTAQEWGLIARCTVLVYGYILWRSSQHFNFTF